MFASYADLDNVGDIDIVSIAFFRIIKTRRRKVLFIAKTKGATITTATDLQKLMMGGGRPWMLGIWSETVKKVLFSAVLLFHLEKCRSSIKIHGVKKLFQ